MVVLENKALVNTEHKVRDDCTEERSILWEKSCSCSPVVPSGRLAEYVELRTSSR